MCRANGAPQRLPDRFVRNRRVCSAPAAWARSTARATPSSARDVAIKVLPELFASDPERVARFEREAQVLAVAQSSQHRGASTDSSSRRRRVLVMELVEGTTLADRMRAGALPLDEALRDRAPDRRGARGRARQGHRPSRPEAGEHQGHADGAVKVLDFGLAKASSNRRSDRRRLELADV